MSRTDTMAMIDAALLGPTPASPGGMTGTSQNVMEPHPAPGIDAPSPIADNLQGDQPSSTNQNDIVANQENIVQQEMQDQLAQEDAFTRSANATTRALSKIWQGTTNRLGSLPAPGTIIFPLAVLLVFFFLLIPVNGHTRFVWLWLVFSGNAEIQNDNTGGGGGDFGNTTDTSGGGIVSGNFGSPNNTSGGSAGGSFLPTLPLPSAGGMFFGGNEVPE